MRIIIRKYNLKSYKIKNKLKKKINNRVKVIKIKSVNL